MKQKIFTFTRKLINYSILISYLWLSIGQSYAMEPQLDLDRNGFKYRITGVESIDRGYGQEEDEELELCQSKGFEIISDATTSEERRHSSLGATPTNGWESVGGLPNSRNATPTHGLFKVLETTPPRKYSSDKSSRSNTPENNSNRATPQFMWTSPKGIRSNAATPTYDLLGRLPSKFPDMPDMPDVENGTISISLRVIALKKPIPFLQGIEESPVSRESNDATGAEKTNSAEEAEDKKEEPNIKLPLSDNLSYYAQATVSGASSLLGSTGLAILAYNLGARKNQEIAYILFIDSLIANAILFHKNNMGLSTNDIPYDHSKSLSQNTYTCSSCLLKFTAAGISSIPAAYVSGIVTNDISPALSSAVYAFNFIDTLLLFHKAQIAFVNYFDELLKLRNTKNERIWFYKSRLEEVAALSRDEIHILYDKFKEAKEPESKHITDDKFEDLMKQIKSTGSDTQKQFWLKEGAGIAFGPGLAGIFGGMYIFKVGFTLYNLFLHATNSELSPKDILALTYVGALILSIVQNTVQIKSAYEVFKACAIKLSRTVDTEISIRNPFISSENKRNINQFEQLQEYASDGLSVLLAGGAAAARAELCIDYMKDPALLTFVLTGTSVAFFSTFYWALSSYFESFTEIGKKRSEIMAAIKSKIVL
jgi:hypothetical protein